ncbi:hypothetical protein [Streptomyces nondiastaticus]|uniref:Uncharacterized protein n=1 Tax=Streptomyces nondiastaticus TaxID=3154512 RepID=A0ABW6U7M3_9ACTN
MGFGTHTRRVRDERVPLIRRHRALRCAVGHYCPLGFNATWAYLAATACPAPDLRRDPEALLRALATLEESRAARLAEAADFAVRRHAEKAAGRRTPRASDTALLRGPRWPSATAPSRLGLVAAVADRYSAFRQVPYPDDTYHRDIHVYQLAGLHARLDASGSSYLRALGHVGHAAAAELAATVHDIRSLTRPGYAPVHAYLLPWLRFADLLTYATEVATAGHWPNARETAPVRQLP